ncbi:uncharacterized protein [Chelonus insularis]|uniref:uncharacterized protein n=1 Tax=Chelonus insularis TaxID=460826 RepID=UPI00158E8902|nr:uncharacterized protein LOC118067553 [Chelonus insularis]
MKIFNIFMLTFVVVHTHSLGNNLKSPKAGGNSRLTPSPESETVIENKNVNIVVNVDPKEVAKELWSIIEERMDKPPSRRSPLTQQIMTELENIITPIIRPTRRSQPSAYEVAAALDHVTRRAFKNDIGQSNAIENEIVTRNTVADMMSTLKEIQSQEKQSSDSSETGTNLGQTRRTLSSLKDNHFSNNNNNLDDDFDDNDKDSDDDYVKLSIKVKKEVLRRALRKQ